MSDATQSKSLSEDIAFIRNLVEDGQKGGYRGEIGVAAGLIWGTASLYYWAAWAKVVELPGGMAGASLAWPAAVVVFALAGVPLGMFRRGGGNRAMMAAWMGVGLACWTLAFVVGLAAWRTQMWTLWALLPPIIMTLYGGAWLVTAAVVRRYWMTGVGILSLLSSLALAYTVFQPVEYLLFALFLYLLMAAPSLYGMLRLRSQA